MLCVLLCCHGVTANCNIAQDVDEITTDSMSMKTNEILSGSESTWQDCD